jgi:2OG-Fe(II) oxygenase superfamily
MISNEQIYQPFDLLQLDLLPINWLRQIAEVVEKRAQRTLLDGKSSTSREPIGSEVVEVFVVPGDVISVDLPWLYDLYTSALCKLASEAAGHQVYASQDLVSSININVLRGMGSRYEWHVDSNPLTGILYVTSHLSSEDGGELLFKRGDEQIAVHPKSGTFIAFDAREIPHTVLPLKKEGVRISIPMNYYDSPERQDRPSDIDSYLYQNKP